MDMNIGIKAGREIKIQNNDGQFLFSKNHHPYFMVRKR